MPTPAEMKAKLAYLEEQGWQKQFTTDGSRLDEMVEFYRELGFEVLLESVCDERPLPECASCFETLCDKYKTIFIRKSKVAPH